MTKQVQDEKITHSLGKFGNLLQQQRTMILKKDIAEFALHLNSFSDIEFTSEIIENMEKGIDVSIKYWLVIWLYFQNLDKIIQAYDIKEMLFLSQQEFIPNIEQEILAHHKNK